MVVFDDDGFRQPESKNIRLWRYMDFTKFVSLISSSKLYFCRSDLFKDTFEGSCSIANVQVRPDIYHDIANFQSFLDTMSKIRESTKKWTYINCWHANEYESAAMWVLYAKTNEAIAVETDYLSLKKVLNVLPDKILMGLVNYIDYTNDFMFEKKLTNPFMYKRKSFEHEKEVRALIVDWPVDKNMHANDFIDMKNEISGKNIKIELNSLIKNIYVSPTASNWLVDLTKEITKKYNIDADVKKSDLYSEPIY